MKNEMLKIITFFESILTRGFFFWVGRGVGILVNSLWPADFKFHMLRQKSGMSRWIGFDLTHWYSAKVSVYSNAANYQKIINILIFKKHFSKHFSSLNTNQSCQTYLILYHGSLSDGELKLRRQRKGVVKNDADQPGI